MNVHEVSSARDLKQFIAFPAALYAGNPNFVPHLTMERNEFFNRQKNPLFKFTEAALFLATDDSGRVLGRVSAHINRRHNDYWKEQTGFFGFFESRDDFAIARALMGRVEQWLRERGMKVMRGPFNFSTNDECGFLAEGFDRPPSIMMTYTQPAYLDWMTQLGLVKAKDLLAFEWDVDQNQHPEFLLKIGRRAQERTGVTIRPLDLKDFDREVARAFSVYNAAWEKNWGFIPMTEDEFKFVAKGLKPIIDPTLALVVEKDGAFIGFSIAIPDINQILRTIGGKLFPFGWYYLLTARKRVNGIRVLAMGVVEEYRSKGLDALLYGVTFENFLKRGLKKCEMSWTLEDNDAINRAMLRMDAKVTKRYRIFEKAL